MAGFAKGMATTSGWTLVQCDCRNLIQQDRALMDGSRAMKMAAAAGYGGDVQVRTKESIAQDSGDDNDSSCYFCEPLIFSGLLWMQPCTEPPSSEGETMDGVQGFQAACCT